MIEKNGLTRFPSLRPPWMAEVPALQEQQTGRLLFSNNLLGFDVQATVQKPVNHSRITYLSDSCGVWHLW